MSITIEHKSRTTRPRTAGASPQTTPIAELAIDGEVVETIVFGLSLDRRLERQGISRETYAAQRAAALVLSRSRSRSR
jgi:hypothetical protein